MRWHQNLTSSTRFFITFLAQYCISNIKAWSLLLPLQTANCSIAERNQFCQMERFLKTILHFQLLANMEPFFSDVTYYELNEYVNKQNLCYCLADNPNWQITKSLHSEQVTVWYAISQYRIIVPFFSRTKTGILLMLIPRSMKFIENCFFGIEEMSSYPKTNLVSTGQATPHQGWHLMCRVILYC